MYAMNNFFSYIENAHVISFTILLIVFCAGWKFLWKKIAHPYLELVFTLLLGCIILLFISPGWIWMMQFVGSSAAIDLFLVAAAVFTIWGINYLPLEVADYELLGLFLYVLLEKCFIWCRYGSMMLFGGYTMLLLETYFTLGKVKKNAIRILVSFFSGVLVFVIYKFLLDGKIRRAYYDIAAVLNIQRIGKICLLFLFTIPIVLLGIGLVWLLRKFLGNYLERLQEFSDKYEELGNYLLIIPYLCAIMMYLGESLFWIEYFNDNERKGLIFCIIALFIGIQIFYLKLISSTISLKEHIAYQEMEHDRERLYHSDVGKNMQEIREMKHDLKNIFLTMGEYVSRSSDAELKEYYFEKIAPFAQNEIYRNDLYVQLEAIKNEGIKAFIYYKFLQILEAKINLSFHTELDGTYFPFIVEDTILIRIIGIFIDNAMEEAAQQTEGNITIVIKEKDGAASFIIQNTVRAEIRKQGIYAGVSSKGLGRGNGLSIVQKLVKQHQDILWNSYFKEDNFVQCITFYKKNLA